MRNLLSVRRRGRVRIQCSGVFFGSFNSNGKANAHQRRDSTKKGEIMKKMLLSIALVVVAPFAWGQVSETTTTTTTTEGTGTITEYTPGSAIVLRETSGPVRYRFGKTVTYVTRSGRVLDEDTVRTRIRVGIPVRVHYVGTAPDMAVDRVILEED
jgi:hypothetical protein